MISQKIARTIRYLQKNDPCHYLKNEKIDELIDVLEKKNERITLRLALKMKRNVEKGLKNQDPNPHQNHELIDEIIKILEGT